MALAAVTQAIAHHRRGRIASPNRSSAMTDVATISKLFKREAFAAVVFASPAIRQIGAAMSRTTIPTVKGRSFFVSGSSPWPMFAAFWIFPTKNIPMPAPRYKNPASKAAGTWLRSSLETGEFTA